MKRLLFSSIFFVMLAFMFVGCTTVRYELVTVTNNPVGSKVGEASILPVAKFGTKPAKLSGSFGGIYQAAKNGGITSIAVVEKRFTVKSGIIKKLDLIVYGD